jgi:tRNA dimethylallyltransferase
LPVVLGPTGVGKTNIGIEIARKIGAEIIVCDSRQIYQGMDIGTNKPTKEELSQVKHWLIDIVTPNESLNAWEYAKLARKKIKEIWKRNKTALVIAGSGLYLRALIDGFFEIDESTKSTIRKKLKAQTSNELYKRLSIIDPVTACKLHPNDKLRIMRAIEVYEITGVPISIKNKKRLPFDCKPLYIGLSMHRDLLYKRINERVEYMICNRLLEEVKNLLQSYSPELNALQTIGYKEIISYLRGEISFNEAIRLIKRNTRRYAKRQITWFKKMRAVQWFNLPDHKIVDKCLALISSK